jgi:hypothetical protein
VNTRTAQRPGKRTRHKLIPNSAKLVRLLAVLLFAFPISSLAQNPASVEQADQLLVQAWKDNDRAAVESFLHPDFTWIESKGRRLSRSAALQELPRLANTDVTTESRVYGNTAIVRANRGRVNVLRIWVKRDAQWRAVLYQEVTQVEKSEAPGPSAPGECINPCKEIPFQPQNASEREAIVSWQGVMQAMAGNDADAYAPLIADEFTATDTFHDRPYTKTDRLEQINRQKIARRRSSPPQLVSAEMFDFGETVMMVAREQRPGGKSYFNSRMWVKRDGRWQMLFSFNTQIE